MMEEGNEAEEVDVLQKFHFAAQLVLPDTCSHLPTTRLSGVLQVVASCTSQPMDRWIFRSLDKTVREGSSE